MFGRWRHKQTQPLPRVALPDLDREAAAHWNRGAAALPIRSASNSLDFGSSVRPTRTRERARGRRRLLASLLLGLLLGLIAVGVAYYVATHVRPMRSGYAALGERITFDLEDEEEIYYSEGVSAAQARRLGNCLQNEGVFGDQRSKSVRLSKTGDVFVVGFVLDWNNWQDEAVVDDFRDLLPRLSRGAFADAPVEIHLCARQPDSKGRPMPTMRVIRADAGP